MYKKLGEVAEAFIGLTYKPEDVAESGTIVLRSSNIQNFKLDFKDLVRVNIPINEAKYVQNGDILMCSRNGSFSLLGKTAMVNNLFEPMSFGAFMTIIRSDYNDYLLHFFRSSIFRQKLLLGKTSTVNQITVKMLKDTIIPLPPLTTQQQIVSELDLLSHILDQKRQQLKEYDALAESIFYDMFGDPVENPKGWEVSAFSQLFKLKSGDALSAKNIIEGVYPVFGGNGISGYHHKYNKDGEYVIIGRVGVYCGNVRCVKGQFWLTDNAFELIYDKCHFDSLFLSQLLSIMNLNQYAHAAAQPVISNNNLKNVIVSLPPLTLQRSFAAKIESIEHQKQLLRASIKETEMLFQSRMDYWFNS